MLVSHVMGKYCSHDDGQNSSDCFNEGERKELVGIFGMTYILIHFIITTVSGYIYHTVYTHTHTHIYIISN